MFNEKSIKREDIEEKKEDTQPELKPVIEKPSPKPEQTKSFAVNVAMLNVRANPSDKADVITTIPNGTVIQVNLTESKGVWSKVTMPVDGYVMSKFIAPVK